MSIQELEASLQGGSRENRFLLEFTLPAGVGGDVRTFNVLVLSTSVPGKTRGAITIQHSGKTRRLAGDDVTDETFPVVFQVPKDAKVIYENMRTWYDLGNGDDYKVNIKCSQLDRQNTKVFSWNIIGCWLSTLPPVDFNRESQDTIKQFDATFTVDDIDVA